MARTRDLRRLIESTLNDLKTEYGIPDNGITYRVASDKVMWPHVVFYLESMTPTDMGREDYQLDIDIWAKDQAWALDFTDTIIDLFSFNNAPQETILPTFYLVSSGQIEDPDKTIIHMVVRFTVQTFRRIEENGSND